MVNLTRIYTRTGDGGATRLGDSSQVRKTDARVEAYGTVDELNSVLGVLLAGVVPGAVEPILRRVQNELFDLGADLCRPQAGTATDAELRIAAGQVQRLEGEIDRCNDLLGPLRSFVLPGGTPAAAWLHLARTVCRRAERRAWSLAEREEVNPQALAYLNRLSDLLFVLARTANRGGPGDLLWEPGATR